MRDDETVREVCAEANLQDWYTLPREESRSIHLLTKRIISAHESELAANDEMDRIAAQSAHARFDEEMAAKDAEIERLNDELFAYAGGHVITGAERCLKEKNGQLESRIALLERALKPVMDLDMSKFGFAVDYGECFEAVREAQRIMKEGVAK